MRVFVATDLSPGADEAVRQAHARATDAGAELTVCHIVPSLIRSHVLLPHLAVREALDAPEHREQIAEAVAERVTELTGRNPSTFQVLLDEGAPYERILHHAQAWNSDLVVVGSQGTTGVARLLLGSVADKVIRHAHVPVLIARPSPKTKRILVGTDFSDPALPAVAAAAEEARRTGGPITILHSIEQTIPLSAYMGVPFGGAAPMGPTPQVVAEIRRAAEERLADALARCETTGDRRVEDGPPGAALVRASEEIEAELVVVGTVGRTGLARALLGSVAETVARSAPCSVLVVRLDRTGGR